MAPFATPAFLALATATGIFRVAGSVPALLKVRTSRALGANTFSTIQVRFGQRAKYHWYNISGLEIAGTWSEMMVQVDPTLQLVQLRTLGTDAWRMSQLEVVVPSGGSNVTYLPQCCVPLWLDSDNVFAVRMVTIFLGQRPPLPMPVVRTGPGFQLQRRNAGCSNWKESRLGFSYEKDVGNCAAVCHATKHCVAFEIVTNASCRPMWTDQKGKGYCQLLSQKCQPFHLGMDCWDQYEMIDRGWHKAATFAVGIVPPVVLLLAYIVASCRSQWKRGAAQNGHLVSDSDVASDGSGSDSSTESGECAQNHWEDPAWAAITMQQLLDLHQKARQEFQDEFPNITMHHVNARILQPLCEKHGKCYAHIVNAEEPLLLNVFVSHAWQEGFDEFVQYVASPFRHWSLQPNLWICATALIQSRDASKVSAQVGVGEHPEAAPFTRALLRAGRLLVVRNQAVNLFERIWCCWELFKAYEIGLVATPGALMITGPADTNMAPVKIQQALASDPEDKKRIMRHIHQMARDRNGPSIEQINQTLTHIKFFRQEVVFSHSATASDFSDD